MSKHVRGLRQRKALRVRLHSTAGRTRAALVTNRNQQPASPFLRVKVAKTTPTAATVSDARSINVCVPARFDNGATIPRFCVSEQVSALLVRSALLDSAWVSSTEGKTCLTVVPVLRSQPAGSDRNALQARVGLFRKTLFAKAAPTVATVASARKVSALTHPPALLVAVATMTKRRSRTSKTNLQLPSAANVAFTRCVE